ncbi:hypothetical protein BDW02DRAFT_565938 [Decorospora gaudefroyi]|uniref:DUF6594 domain-containing protein n=1 Tax=Decorospora gaudefroyi TaxID=184978 RepID=A0A6A5KV09_9PLEO|nr:hypothetical protein BDW02DRAFT_565938 [Decorospora gaudefroyi]
MPQETQTLCATLPGPATAPEAHMPTPVPDTSIPMQHLGTGDRSKAWQTEGYKALSKWMASENDFFVFRRFESLNANTILYLQHRITELEKRLESIHGMIEGSAPEQKLKNSSFGWDAKYMPERSQIMSELSCLLMHYNQYIEAFSKIRTRPRAEKRQIDNVENWLARRAITKEETDFVNHKSDLITINSRSRPPLGQWLETCQNLHLWKLFKAKHLDGLHVPSAATAYSSDEAFERFTTLGIIFVGLIMLLAPMWWLECVPDSKARLGVITGFVCVFMLAMTTATINRPFEVVAATAAYAAVLMVFMQIEGNGNN